MKDYLDAFPFEKIRDQQQQAIDFCIDSFLNNDKRFCIIEAGTGVGKSAIGLTVSRYLSDKMQNTAGLFQPGAYFLTTQKILQEQYVKDFPTVISLKSSSNYKCGYHKNNSCADSQKLLKTEEKSSRFFKACSFNCVYKNQKQKFLESSEGVTNFSYFLTETNFSGKILPRQVLVIDEGHNIESELSKFVEISVSEYFAKNVLKLQFPQKQTHYQMFLWIKDVYLPSASRRLKHYENTIENLGGDKMREKLSQFKDLTRNYDMLRSHIGKIKKFITLHSTDNWVFETSETEKRGYKKATFKPIDVSVYAEDSLFHMGEKVIIMSATIMNYDIFKRTLGIDDSNSCFISLPSPFPKENRPIIKSGVGSMSHRAINTSLPRLKIAVQEIMKEHANEKGIIHCHTYRIARYLKYNIKNRDLASRILIHNSSNRDEILRKHINSKKATVLLSPSMSEGVDLKDDSSRFQIICKVPYPFLGDKLIRKRMNNIPGWYDLQTAKLIVQAAGRSIRSDTDHAVTYILDSDFERFFSKSSKLFSSDFKSCIVS